MSPRLLVTGSRKWTDEATIRYALLQAWQDLGMRRDVTLIHGACPTGADFLADRIWTRAGLPVERHPADWAQLKRAAGPIRNQGMVRAGADLCLAFLLPGSRGTLDCARRAEAAGIPIRRYYKDPIDPGDGPGV